MARSIILDISVVGGSVVVKSIILDILVVEWSVVVQSFLVDNSVVCRSVVVKSRELDEPVESCRAVVDISVAIRSVEVEPTLRLVVSDKGTSEEVESKRLVNSVVAVFVEIGSTREIGTVCCRSVMTEPIGVGISFGCKSVVAVASWLNVWITCVFVIVVSGLSDSLLCGSRVEPVWLDISCGDWSVVVVVPWLDVSVAGSYVVVVSRRCDGSVETGSVVFNSPSADEWVLGILVTVESVELSEDDASSVLIMSNDEYVVSDSTSCVVMFGGGISAINISVKLEQQI